jgi:hypothetical protein
MDILKALRELHQEKQRLDATISSLEAHLKNEAHLKTARAGAPAKRRRGRKSMSAAERQAVSRRMTLYWEARRAQPQPSPALPNAENQQASSASAS